MPTTRFEPSTIKNKVKREEVARKQKKAKRQEKLQRRLAQAKAEANDPLAKKKRLAQNVPRTLDNSREYDPSMLTANPHPEPGPSTLASQVDPSSSSNAQPEAEQQPQDEHAADIATDPFAAYFSRAFDPTVPPKVLVTTSPKATRMTHLIVVNEDMKKPNAITMVHLPEGPTAYFKLTSVELSQKISGHARATAHYPELVLNGFVTRLGHTVGRLFQTLFPPMPEFQGRQVVTLHNQRDFLFFRRHRYAFRSPEKVALQEIGPRFTLKLRYLKKGLPAVKNLGAPSKPLEFDTEENQQQQQQQQEAQALKEVEMGEAAPQVEQGEDEDEVKLQEAKQKKVVPPTEDEYLWIWKPELETTRRTFFL
ncbi:hypothetical protein BN946_scf184969.g22 [Trametes cinnabarina]|uniref:Brix domain-containing protein n=1 Tax=Pycnoporus cinnabarinus TaxID=5643 RepID=A0A060SU52_PYCCI|nr:hypothetical protein BN946_scf184969.g22 [Trametes cinnabarina]